MLLTICIHQIGIYQVLAEQSGFGEPTSESTVYFRDFMSRYGDFHRTFGHGCMAAIFLAFPLIGIPALFERRSWKYILY